MKTETVAVMLTDIAGFTQKTNEQTYEQNAAMLRRHRQIIHPLVHAYGGRVVKEIGDAVLATFGSPTRAVQAAMAIQDALAMRNRQGKDPLRLRIAINVGEVRLENGDVFGEAVNVAARIEAETPVDHIYVSGSTYLTMNRTGVPLEFLGQRPMKGVPEPVTLFSVTPAGDGLPYGGRELHALAIRRRRRMGRMVAVAAALLLCVGAAALGIRPTFVARHLDAELASAVQTGRWDDAITALDGLAALGRLEDEQVQKLLHGVAQMSDAEGACLLIDGLRHHRGPRDWLRPEALFGLRLTHSFALLKEGELAQAEVCMGTVEDQPNASEARLLELLQIHHAALTALRAHADKDLRAALRRYEAFMRAGAPPEEHVGFIVNMALAGYATPLSRPVADSLIAEFLRDKAAVLLAHELTAGSTDATSRVWMLARLEEVGESTGLDWQAIYSAQMDSPICGLRRAGVDGLRRRGDIGAVGVLLREAKKNDACTRLPARGAAEELVANGREGGRPSKDAGVFVATRL